MTAWRYRFAGLLFESALHLPEWEAFAITEASPIPDARIVVERDAGAAPAESEYCFSVPDVGEYRILNGERIAIFPAPDVPDARLRVFLMGSALAALAVQRGLLFLHGSAVRLAGRTIALCGPAGSGKSSLAAALLARGASFVCDDLGRFDVDAGRAVVYPSTPRLKLSPETLAALDWRPDGCARVFPGARKFHVPQTLDDAWSPVPLDAICVLDWDGNPVCVTRLSGREALQALVAAATYRPGMLDAHGRLGHHWAQCVELTAAVPVYRLTRARTWDAIDDVIAAIGGLR